MVNKSVFKNLNGDFKVIAHRGASALAPENTISSLKLALEAQADIIEIDVHLSKDNQVVAIHDNTLNRTTSGRGRVRDFTLMELQELDAGSWFGKNFCGQYIPTLKEVLQLPTENAKVNVELKGSLKEYPLLPEKVVEVISGCDAANRCVITSFNSEFLEKINAIAPKLELGEIHYMHFPYKWNSRIKKFASEINPLWYFVSKSFVNKAHERGIRVHPWTINNKFVVSRLLKLNVDGMITNDPQRLVQILKERGLR